ncbi:MAG: globin [Candidatus Dormibacteraeota bacterium]|nr:globin [Candidatus Dormibacteraeota bacterium]
MRGAAATVYELAGGEAVFTAIVDHFYAAVATDPVLRPLYPADPEQLAQAQEHLRLFLIQYWGGPGWYSERRGHPRLRMRHAPFPIGHRERIAWLKLMREAVYSVELPEPVRESFLEYFESAALAMMNRADPFAEPPPS